MTAMRDTKLYTAAEVKRAVRSVLDAAWRDGVLTGSAPADFTLVISEVLRTSKGTEGFAVVPVEPTEAMQEAALRYLRTDSLTNITVAYEAMLSAAQEGK